MYKNILLAVDDRGLSANAEPIVVSLARRSTAQVLVVSVLDEHWNYEIVDAARDRLDGMVARLAAAGVQARAMVLPVRPEPVASQIVRAAREFGADLVALGSRGRGSLTGMLLGSVSHEVAAKLDCPIVIVHGEAREDGVDLDSRPIRRVLVAVNGSEESAAALEAARQLATEHAGAVLAVHAREVSSFGGPTPYIEPEEVTQGLLDEATQVLIGTAGPVGSKALLDPAPAAEQIARAAEEWNADVIVLGSRRLTDLGGLLVGSVAHGVIQRTARPVLLAGRPGRVAAEAR